MMRSFTNNIAKIIMINNKGGEVNRNEHNRVRTLEAMHATVKNVHVIDIMMMRLRKTEGGAHALTRRVQVRPRHGTLRHGLQQELQRGGNTGPMGALNANHQRILIRKEDLLCISGFSSSL